MTTTAQSKKLKALAKKLDKIAQDMSVNMPSGEYFTNKDCYAKLVYVADNLLRVADNTKKK